MPYVKTVWVNGTASALNDSNLNKIEQGIFDSLRQDGSTTMSGQLVTTAGTAATPAIAPTGDSNTGIFFPAADTIAFGEGGTETMRITPDGSVLIGTTTPFTSVTSGSPIVVSGLGIYPAIQSSTATNTARTIATLQNSNVYIGNGSTTDGSQGIFVSPRVSNDGSGGSSQVSATGIVSQPVFESSSLTGRIAIVGGNTNAVRNFPNDLSTNASNFLAGIQSACSHTTTAGAGILTNIAVSNQATLTNQNGTMTTANSYQATFNVGNTTSALNSTVTTGNGNLTAFTIGNNSAAGTGTVTTLYGFRSTLTINNTGTVGTFYGLHLGAKTGAGTLTTNWGVYQEDTGATNYFAGNVGIGTATPTDRLEVSGGIRRKLTTFGSNASPAQEVGLQYQFDNSTSRSGIYFHNTYDNNGRTWMSFWMTDASNVFKEKMRIDGFSENVLIGYTSSNGAYPLQVNGQIFATSSTIATSDGRYKEDIVSLDGALDIVAALNPVQFKWKQHPVHNFNTEVPTIGFIAQEVAEVLKDKAYLTSVIKKSECTWETETGEIIEREVTRDVEKQVEREVIEEVDGEEIARTITETVIEQVTEIVTEPVKETHTEEFFGIAESNMIAILTKAIKELNAKVEALEAQIANQ